MTNWIVVLGTIGALILFSIIGYFRIREELLKSKRERRKRRDEDE